MDFLGFTFFQEQCAICERSKQEAAAFLCADCYHSLPHMHVGSSVLCFRCGIEIPSALAGTMTTTAQPSCGECLARDPVQYRSVSAFHYVFPLPEFIAEIKFQRQLAHLDLLASLFSDYCQQQYQHDSLPEVIIPVPLHAHRQFQRSFNQSELFSQHIAKKLAIKNQSHWVRRVRHTPSQMQLSIKEREKNMRNAFALSPAFPTANPTQHVAVFDDVLTTGATAQSICLLLKRAGVQRVDIWSLARTPKPK